MIAHTRGGYFDRYLCSAEAHLAAGNFTQALADIRGLLHEVPKWPDSSMKFMPCQGLDFFVETLGSQIERQYLSDVQSVEKQSNVADVVILTSALLKTGGHTREIEDWVSGLVDTRVAVVTSELSGHSDPAIVAQVSRYADYHAHQYDDPLEIIQWLVRLIARLNPDRIIVSPSHQDVALLTALSILKFDGKLIINLNLDHNVSPGLFLSRVDNIIAKRPYLYCVIKNEYKLDKVLYIPFARSPSLDGAAIISDKANGEAIVSCACTSSLYKIENDYAYRYADVIADLIIKARVRHVHIGVLSEAIHSEIHDRLMQHNISSDHFVHIPYAERLSDVFQAYDVDVLIQTFPVGGGLVPIEAMEAGLMVLSHRPYNSKLYNPVDFCYLGALTWSEPAQLFDIIGGLDAPLLQQHKENAAAHYQQFNRPGAIEHLLASGDMTAYPVDEQWCNALFDYPLDSFRVHANRNARSKPVKSPVEKIRRELDRIKRRLRRLVVET